GDPAPAESLLGAGFPASEGSPPAAADLPEGIDAAPYVAPISGPIETPLPTEDADRADSTEPADPGTDPPSEPAPATIHRNLQNEPTNPAGVHRNLQNEPTNPADARRNLRNPGTVIRRGRTQTRKSPQDNPVTRRSQPGDGSIQY